MLTESATVLSVESDGVWVEARARSQCGRCQARKGCGHALLDALMGRQNRLRALSDDSRLLKGLRAGDSVTIGVPEQMVLTGSLLLYLFPLLTMTLVALLPVSLDAGEGVVVAAAASGLAAGLLLLRHGNLRWMQPPQARLLRRNPVHDDREAHSLTIREV